LVASSAGSPTLTSATSTTFDVTTEICYADAFSNLTNWSVGSEGNYNFTPQVASYVVNGNTVKRMQLTNSNGGISTYASLQRLFPAFGNKVTVKFKLYAYNGNGGDGIAVTLSDASVAPVAGAFGGSLGYAPKLISAGGEVDHAGFTGGWIGIAIDEFGNFSNNTEGRTGGSAPGLTADSVSIRGSGSGYSGYNYLRGTATLPTSIDITGSTPGPGHLYRIIVDHTDGVHAWTSVERSTTGLDAGLTMIISPFDAKAAAGQAVLPTNWWLSFTGSTGGNYNTHEIENISVCSPVQQTLTLHHVRLEYPATGLTCGGGITPVVVKACANAACSILYPNSVTVGLTASSGTLSSNSVTFTGGQTSVNLVSAVAASITLTGSVTAPSISTAKCYTGSSETACNVTPVVYTASSTCFNAAEPNGTPGSRLLTKLASVPFNVDVLAVNGGGVDTTSTKQFWVSLVNPNSPAGICTSNSTSGLLTGETNYTFVAADKGRKTFTYTYPTAIPNIKVRIRDTTGATCSSDDFTVRPYGFTLATNPVSGSTTLKAGTDSFAVQATPVISSLAYVAGYSGFPKVNASLLTGDPDVGGLVSTPAATPPTFATTIGANTYAEGSFVYSNVGTLTFSPNSVYDDAWVDHDIANGDCTLDFSNALASGKYGCKFGNISAGTAGRFIPDHFRTVITPTMACGANTTFLATFLPPCTTGFIYAAQPFTTTVTAYYGGASPGVATNYAGTNAKAVTLSTFTSLGGATATSNGTLGNFNMPASAFPVGSGGVGTMTTTAYTFTTPLTVPTDIYMRAIDTDGVSSLRSPSTASVEGTAKILSGRVRMLNAYGSELLDLPMSMRAEFWQANNQGWVTNLADTITDATLAFTALGTSDIRSRTCVIEASSTTNTSGVACLTNPTLISRAYNETGNPLFAGNFNLYLKAPGAAAAGVYPATIKVTATVPTWLEYYWNSSTLTMPSALATFGATKPSRVIYRQEMVK
jgi:MSHA biogenesis protein MshQ